jgi:two-component system cell cycle response regulator DivK
MKKILLVEDNEMNRDMLTRRLTRKGYEVIGAVDGEDAIQKVATTAPDLVLMDMRLPGIDGLEATRQIRSDGLAHRTPIIMLTANATVEDLNAARAAGCDDFETKPIDFPRLIQKIDGCLRKALETHK